jgi:hypothetical protein
VSDIKLSNHGAVIDFDCQNTVVSDGSTFRKASIDGGNFEQFQEAMSSGLMEFNEVFRDEGTSSLCWGLGFGQWKQQFLLEL